ncbi:MAG TPA: hypothetical protein VE152_06740 [Acidimicrobiales bacterium]|nr:hypothetical protein [Acidimicrobiales bacterium]
MAVAVARRPTLWRAAVGATLGVARPGWWRRWPPVPAPDPDWLAFRLECASGQATGPLRAEDVVAWLRWWRELPSWAR